MSRVFAALHVPDDVLDQIIELRSNIYPDNLIRWEKKSKLHITLKFFGEVAVEKIDEIIIGLNETIKNYSALNLTFNKFGLFKNKGNAKIVWAGLKPDDNLFTLVKNINQKMVDNGFDNERRKFHPHLTLLRLRGNEKMEIINKFEDYNFEEIQFTGNKISLFESKLLRSGSEYKAIKSFELN
jgi:2'-5' RNA ligase